MKTVIKFQEANGKVPFQDWFNTLEWSIQAKIDGYIFRVRLGGSNKNVKSLKDGLYEIKINTGPGFRVYYATVESNQILLLLGGDKSSQKRDILRSKNYLRIYEKNQNI